MKKLTSFTLLLVMLLGVACAPANKQSINAKDLIGKYEIDFSPLIANDSSDIEDTDLALGMLAFLACTLPSNLARTVWSLI